MASREFQALLGAFKDVPARLERNLAGAVRMAAELAANEARANHAYTDRSGVLTSSTQPDGPHGSFRNKTLHALLSAGAPYAVFVEKGTKPHKIKPRYRKVLRWPVEGGFRFANVVNHPGTAATHFLEDAVGEVIPTLVDKLLPEAIELSFVEAGFQR